MNTEDILALHAAELITASKEGTPELVRLHAWRGTRTRVHAALQEQKAPPERGEEHAAYQAKLAALATGQLALTSEALDAVVTHRVASDDTHHQRQKAHFTDLWVEADRLVAAAGIANPEASPVAA